MALKIAEEKARRQMEDLAMEIFKKYGFDFKDREKMMNVLKNSIEIK